MFRDLVRARTIAIVLGVGLAFATNSAEGDDRIPVTVAISGNGAIRVRVAEGIGIHTVAPCDSSSNRMLFDSTVAAGSVVTLAAARRCICVEQTHAGSREWLPAQFACLLQLDRIQVAEVG